MLHVASGHLGLRPTAPEQIDPPRPCNGAASVVVEHRARGWPRGSNLSMRSQHRLLELHERQPARRKEALIRGYRTARHEDQSEIALGTMVNRTKEDVARIAVEN